ncbi:MAG: VCBS repeat-containing protein [Deltaproteobacteria bacterium]|nr:VCBS repeat-containing protein [Deltaproteobacteria bacterium]
MIPNRVLQIGIQVVLALVLAYGVPGCGDDDSGTDAGDVAVEDGVDGEGGDGEDLEGGDVETWEVGPGQCIVDDDCPEGFTCVDSTCYAPCGEGLDCPDGYYCNPGGQCIYKECETSADCTDGENAECDPLLFVCIPPEVPVAPTIAFFRASPPAAVIGEPTPITFVWDYGTFPSPAASCSISNGVGDVTETVVHSVTGTMLPQTFTLTCTNGAGSASASVIVPGLPSTMLSLEVLPDGATYDFGVASLVIPPGAVVEATTISARLSSHFTPSPDLATLPVEFYPHGFSFLQPVTLTLPIATALLAPAGWDVALGDLHVAVTGDDGWDLRIFTEVDETARTLTAQIGHFSEAAGSTGSGSCDAPPLSAPKKSLLQRAEIMRLGGVNGYPAVYGQVYDDRKQTDRDRMADVRDPLATDRPEGSIRDAATADFDGDNRDETVVATRYRSGDRYVARLTVLDSCHSSAEPGNCWNDMRGVKTIEVLKDDGSPFPSISDIRVAAGDLDGDGLAEIAAVVELHGGGGWLVRYDDAAHDYARPADSHSHNYDSSVADFRIAVGDINHRLKGDRAEEIAVVVTHLSSSPFRPVMLVYPNAMDNASISSPSKIPDGNIFPAGLNHSRPSVAMADIDNDGDQDIVVAAFHRGEREMRVESYRLNRDQNSFTRTGEAADWTGQNYDNDMSPLLAGADFNGDGRSEVVVVQRRQDSAIALFFTLDAAGRSAWGVGSSLIKYIERSNGPHYLAAGDIDADLKDDVVIGELRPGTSEYDISIVGGSGIEYRKSWRPGAGSRTWAPVLAVGDFDGDNLTVEYTGNCTVNQSDIRPLVAMAAPPVARDLDQNWEDSSTDYGSSTSTSETDSNSVSSKDSITLSLEAEFLGGLFSASASTSLEREFTKTSTSTSSTTLGQSFSAPWLDSSRHNYVLYVVSEYASYEYRIVAAPDPAALTDENELMTIDVPQGTNQYAVTQETYNADAPASLDIGSETFVHTHGDHHSYRTLPECDDLVDGRGWQSATVWVAENGTQTVSIEMSSEAATSEERSTSVDFAAGVSIGGVGLEYGRGYSSSAGYEVSIGDSTEYSGTLGGLSSEPGYWRANRYQFRMVVYKLRRSASLAYTVIDFCVQ